jgi:hypothetical protein
MRDAGVLFKTELMYILKPGALRACTFSHRIIDNSLMSPSDNLVETADCWFVSLTVELPDAPPEKRPAAIGIDVGLDRDDVLHKMTTRIAACYGTIGIEGPNLKGLLKNKRLSHPVSGGTSVGQTAESTHGQSRAARWAGDPGGTLLSFEQDMPLMRMEVGRDSEKASLDDDFTLDEYDQTLLIALLLCYETAARRVARYQTIPS